MSKYRSSLIASSPSIAAQAATLGCGRLHTRKSINLQVVSQTRIIILYTGASQYLFFKAKKILAVAVEFLDHKKRSLGNAKISNTNLDVMLLNSMSSDKVSLPLPNKENGLSSQNSINSKGCL